MSKGLEALESIEMGFSYDNRILYDDEFIIIEKELKALEIIIKEKRVDIDLLLMADNVKEYNKYCHKYINIETQLTKEEYDLLKEVLL